MIVAGRENRSSEHGCGFLSPWVSWMGVRRTLDWLYDSLIVSEVFGHGRSPESISPRAKGVR